VTIPPLSVVIATRGGWQAVAPILDVLLPQLRAVDGEVVVADGRAETPAVPQEVRWIPLRDANLLRLRAIALHNARGAVVAIGEDHYLPGLSWCEAVLRAHTEHPHVAGVVGCLHNATDRTLVGRANFLAFAAPYVRPMPRLPSGRPPPASTLSVKRDVLDEFRVVPGTLESEMIPRLFEEGRLVADDRIVAHHYQDNGVAWSVRNTWASTRASYGYARARLAPARRPHVARWAVGHIPFLLWNEARRATDGRPSRVFDLAAVAVIAAAAGIGGAVGTLLGPGRAAEVVS